MEKAVSRKDAKGAKTQRIRYGSDEPVCKVAFLCVFAPFASLRETTLRYRITFESSAGGVLTGK
jgi:hypothetical protein